MQQNQDQDSWQVPQTLTEERTPYSAAKPRSGLMASTANTYRGKNPLQRSKTKIRTHGKYRKHLQRKEPLTVQQNQDEDSRQVPQTLTARAKEKPLPGPVSSVGCSLHGLVFRSQVCSSSPATFFRGDSS